MGKVIPFRRQLQRRRAVQKRPRPRGTAPPWLPLIALVVVAAAFYMYSIREDAGPGEHAETIGGRASVIDGDTLDIRGTRIRLHGIDAPESGQTCSARGAQYRCGQRAAGALADKIGRRAVSCDRKDVDRYGRIVAVCRVDGEDLNGWMVAQGWAIAYRQFSLDYGGAEQQASASRRGMWEGEFVAPSEWRRRN